LKEEEIILTLLAMLILAGVSVLWLAMVNRRQLRTMEHRERLAMIERGLIPAPEMDPAGFEQRSGLAPAEGSRSAARSRSGGIFLIGLGLALMVLLSFAAGVPGIGVGVGGAFAVLGAAFLFNGLMGDRREDLPYRPPVAMRRPTPPGEPPSNIAP
jgi:hypothetical protein